MAKVTEEQLDKRIALVTKEAADELTFLRSFTVDSSDVYTDAATQVAKLKKELDGIEEERRSFTDPLNDVVKRINAKVKPATTFLDTAIRLLRSAMGAFEMREEVRQRKELEAAAELARKGDVAAASVALSRVESETPKVAGMSSREDWDFEIVDASKLPPEFLQPNEKAIRAFVKAAKRADALPGVRAFPVKVFSQRSA